jgi:hypothetical protein
MVEVRGRARFIEEGVSEAALRIVTRYEGNFACGQDGGIRRRNLAVSVTW